MRVPVVFRANGGNRVSGTLLHVRVVRSARAFRHLPDDILLRILDLAGLAVHAVCRVDLKLFLAALFHDLVNAGGAVALRGLIKLGRLYATGIDSSFSFRCDGWSSS